MVVIMAIRDELFKQFGPLLIEAMLDYLYDNTAQLRHLSGVGPITKEEFFAGIANHLSSLEPYDWMGIPET